MSIKELVNLKSQAYKKIKPDLTIMNDDEIMKLIQDNPSIMVRPLIINGSNLIKGFKEEDYQALQ